jgi:hypothetical protein
MNTQFTLTVDTRPLLVQLGILKDQQIRYAMVNALNSTAKLIQEKVRSRVRREMHLRSKGNFILRQAAIIKFASFKDARYEAVVSVGNKARLLLPVMEDGGERDPRTGKRAIAVPVTGGARPTIGSDVPANLLIKNLPDNRKRSRRKGQAAPSTTVYRVPGVGLFKRSGGRSKMLYSFKKRVPVPKQLGFYDTANKVASGSAGLFFASEMAKAVAHAAGRGPAVKPKPTPPEV